MFWPCESRTSTCPQLRDELELSIERAVPLVVEFPPLGLA
jgi:hypothetical protein